MPQISWIDTFDQEIVNGFNLSTLKKDQCFVNIVNKNPFPVYLYRRFKECHKCAFTEVTGPVLSTSYDAFYRVLSNRSSQSNFSSDENVICELDPNFGQYGVYDINVYDSKCDIHIWQDSVNIYFPILTVVLIYTCLFLLLALLLKIIKRIRKTPTNNSTDEKTKTRVKSLDTFRGICIVGMIFVNYGAGGYEILEHATWNGLQLADVFFPWFLWIMGFCIPISVNSALRRSSKKAAFLNVTRRSCILFALGLFLGSGPYLDKLRIFGVLQRFGICYFVVGGLQIYFHKTEEDQKRDVLKCLCEDILKLKYSWAVMISIVIIHTLITFLVPVPDCPTGYLGPGGFHEDGAFFNCTGGATGYIDSSILGDHIYQGLSIVHVYNSNSIDPEGIIGCLTSIVQVFLGVQAGTIFRTYKEHLRRISRWILWTLGTGLLGALLCGFSKDEGTIPLNKNIWSLSYVLVTSSLALGLFSLCYYIIDVKRFWSGKPILYPGMNSTIMYVGHSMVSSNFPIRWIVSMESQGTTHFMDLTICVWSTCMWVLVAFYLYKIKFFLSI